MDSSSKSSPLLMLILLTAGEEEGVVFPPDVHSRGLTAVKVMTAIEYTNSIYGRHIDNNALESSVSMQPQRKVLDRGHLIGNFFNSQRPITVLWCER